MAAILRKQLTELSQFKKYICGVNHTFVYKTTHRFSAKSSKSPDSYDVVVVGAGILGLATARELAIRQPHLSIAVLDKEKVVAAHQSGHNSGVIHAGIYYKPGSLKAKLCAEGMHLAYKYCDENKVPYNKCGKLIVATNPDEVERLNNLYQRGIQNSVPDLRMLNSDEIKEVEPNCVGLKALHSPHTGIVDWAEVTRSYGRNLEGMGGKVFLSEEVSAFSSSEDSDYPVTVKVINKKSGSPKEKRYFAKYVITCGGLFADRLAEKSGCSPVPKIVPFRGEYLLLKPEKRDLVRGNIYPVPDPRFPFLGVHFTPRINGEVWLGPNAVLAFKREGYSLFDISPKDLYDALAYSGLRKLVFSNFSYAIGELYRGINTRAQVNQLQRFVPKLQPSDVIRGPAGVRAQALAVDGSLVDDFVFDSGTGDISKRIIHVRNAPSPAATSSLAIAKMIVSKAEEQYQLK